MNRLPIYNIVLDGSDGIQKMSLVESPAVESNFLAFAQEKENLQFSINEDEHIVFGCALRADYPIYRRTPDRGEFYVVFNKDTIKQLYEKFLIEGRTSNVNLEHCIETDGVYLIQSFLKDSDNGINPKGFEDVENGSWFCAYKVMNNAVWDNIKQGKFNGFSVEVYCNLQPKNEIEDLIEDLLN